MANDELSRLADTVDELRERLQALCRRIGHRYDALPPERSKCADCGARLTVEAARNAKEGAS